MRIHERKEREKRTQAILHTWHHTDLLYFVLIDQLDRWLNVQKNGKSLPIVSFRSQPSHEQ